MLFGRLEEIYWQAEQIDHITIREDQDALGLDPPAMRLLWLSFSC